MHFICSFFYFFFFLLFSTHSLCLSLPAHPFFLRWPAPFLALPWRCACTELCKRGHNYNQRIDSKRLLCFIFFFFFATKQKKRLQRCLHTAHRATILLFAALVAGKHVGRQVGGAHPGHWRGVLFFFSFWYCRAPQRGHARARASTAALGFLKTKKKQSPAMHPSVPAYANGIACEQQPTTTPWWVYVVLVVIFAVALILYWGMVTVQKRKFMDNVSVFANPIACTSGSARPSLMPRALTKSTAPTATKQAGAALPTAAAAAAAVASPTQPRTWYTAAAPPHATLLF